MLNLKGSFLVVVADAAPHIEILAADETRSLDNALSVASRRREEFRGAVLASVFGPGTVAAIPCTEAAMSFLVAEYQGPQSEAIKALAALVCSWGPLPARGGTEAYRLRVDGHFEFTTEELGK